MWSSTMRRARQTAAEIDKSRYVEWRALREIEVGVCDGLTYAQVTLMLSLLLSSPSLLLSLSCGSTLAAKIPFLII